MRCTMDLDRPVVGPVRDVGFAFTTVLVDHLVLCQDEGKDSKPDEYPPEQEDE